MAVVVVLALGAWWVSNRDQRGASDEAVVIGGAVSAPGADSSGTAPSAPLVALPPNPLSVSAPPPPAGRLRNGTVAPAASTPGTPSIASAAQKMQVPASNAPLNSPLPTATAPTVPRPSAPGGNAADIPPEEIAIDVDKVTLSLRDFRTIMGENPTGTNAEIAKALNGGNPKQARLLQQGLAQNADGELVDRWGTPYFFHQLSKDQMQIRSAGPDRQMWTDDDIFSN